MSVVEVEHVRKFYDKVPALDDVSLTFGEGEFFGLLGPSGSGKTTLLRSIAGFVEPDSGDIRIDGRQVGDAPVHRREIGMVFQNYALFPHMTVFDNVAFGLSVRRMAGGEIKSRVLAMLDLVRLSGLDQRRPRQLSGGQQQRVALARAVVTRPRVLLLDEPLGALDKRLRQQMQIELKQIQREIGITTVFVTHDQEEALTLSDRIAIFNEGRVVQVGAPHAVYERPQTVFAAHFLGDANFFRGRSAGSQRDVGRIELEGGGVVYTRDPLPATGAEVTIAVRPEKLLVRSAQDAIPESRAENFLTGRVLQAVYSGNSITYRVRSGATEMTVFEQNRAAHPWEAGTMVQLAWDPMHSVVVQP